MKITKQGDGIIVDFAGSDPRVSGPMNAPLTVTRSGVYAALKNILDPQNLIPPNSGAWRPVDVRAPEGCVVHAQAPAAVAYANHEMSVRVADMVFRAMYDITPNNVLAGSHGTGGVVIFGGTDYRTDATFISYEVTKGGFGARPIKDGINGVSTPCGNMMNTPVEILEMSFPLRVEEYALVADTGGAGRWRGGLAARRSWRILQRDVHCTTCCDRTMTAPFGLAGGADGAVAKITLDLPDGTTRPVQGKGAFVAPAESVLHFQLPGAGGFGRPSLRDPKRIRDDLAAGYVTAEAARVEYGYEPNP